MRRWIMRHLTGVALVGLLVGLLVPAGASASTKAAAVGIRNGTTTVTTAPGVATALLNAGIAALATSPGQQTLNATTGTVVAKFPVTGGSVGLRPTRATINHRGGLLLANLRVTPIKQAAVDNFVINITQKTLTARLVGTTTRLPIFNLDLSKARVTARNHVVTVTGVRLLLTSAAASGLNGLLGTTVFAANLFFGTASARIVTR